MDKLPLGLIELVIVLAFGIGWFVLERVAKRYDKPKSAKRPDDNTNSK